MKSTLYLLFFIGLSLGTGFLGSIATSESVATWYRTISKPAWTPPDWVFAPVWSTLYIMMGIAAWLVWRRAGFTRPGYIALAIFGAQLGLNFAWSVVFFGLERPGPAFIEIVLLWMAILVTILIFIRHSRSAALLLVPYLGWVTFAACLNFSIWRLNA